MLSRICFAALATCALAVVGPSVHGQDPYGFQFGYTQAYQNSFANRLPTPPYFSVYPPVYYGQRYARPYGDSPYASFPTLRSAPNYYPTPREVPFRTRSVINPYALPKAHARVQSQTNEPVAESAHIGKTVEIINPYTVDRMAIGK